jgi:hypothetical protein
MITREHLSEKELSIRWRISPRTLQRWRLKGEGPAYTKVGRSIRYPLYAVEAYEALHTHSNIEILIPPEKLLIS